MDAAAYYSSRTLLAPARLQHIPFRLWLKSISNGKSLCDEFFKKKIHVFRHIFVMSYLHVLIDETISNIESSNFNIIMR